MKTKLLIKKIVCICLIFALSVSNNFLHETQKINKVYADDLINLDIPAWDGTSASDFAGGTGTQDDPYQISNGEELAYLAKVINNNLPDENGVSYNDNNNYFELTNDIDLANKEWTPIGYHSNFFGSYFNGNNHNIYNLAMSNEDFYNYGLFGIINYSDVHDTNIVNCNININSSTSYTYIGTLAGQIQNSNIFNCFARGTITSPNNSDYIGGLAGFCSMPNSEIYNCVANVDINFSGSSVFCIGGLFAYIVAGPYYIHDCCYIGNIKIINDLNNACYIAGLIGNAGFPTKIFNSYSIGSITAQNCNNSRIGGLVAFMTVDYDVTNCYSIVDINAKSCLQVGGLIAYAVNVYKLDRCFSSCRIAVDKIISNEIVGAVGGLIGSQVSSSNCAVTNCYSAHGSILIGSTDANSYVGGLIGNFYYSWQGNTNSLTNCYSGNIVKVFSPAVPDNIGSFIGNTNAATISNCYFDKDLSEYVSASEKDNENIIGLTTDQMTGYSALKNMSGLFEVTESNTTVAFDVSDNPDVIVDGIYYAHYPHLKYFTSGKNFADVSNSEYSTRAKILNTEQIAKEISFIDETSHRMKGMLKIMRMF